MSLRDALQELVSTRSLDTLDTLVDQAKVLLGTVG